MSQKIYFEWCKNIHSGGLTRCTFCCKEMQTSSSNFRLVHYQECNIAKKFFVDIFNKN